MRDIDRARKYLKEKDISVGDPVLAEWRGECDQVIYEGLHEDSHGVVAMVRLDYEGADELHAVHYSRIVLKVDE